MGPIETVLPVFQKGFIQVNVTRVLNSDSALGSRGWKLIPRDGMTQSRSDC